MPVVVKAQLFWIENVFGEKTNHKFYFIFFFKLISLADYHDQIYQCLRYNFQRFHCNMTTQ